MFSWAPGRRANPQNQPPILYTDSFVCNESSQRSLIIFHLEIDCLAAGSLCQSKWTARTQLENDAQYKRRLQKSTNDA